MISGTHLEGKKETNMKAGCRGAKSSSWGIGLMLARCDLDPLDSSDWPTASGLTRFVKLLSVFVSWRDKINNIPVVTYTERGRLREDALPASCDLVYVGAPQTACRSSSQTLHETRRPFSTQTDSFYSVFLLSRRCEKCSPYLNLQL